MSTHFDGQTYEPQHDLARLSSQQERVMSLMKDGSWRTLAAISCAVHGSEASCSARLRDCRKARWGFWIVERRRVEGGLFEYRLCPPEVQPRLF